MRERRIGLSIAAVLLVLVFALRHPSADIRILTHDSTDRAPARVQAVGALSRDTKLSWAPVPDAARYIVRWRAQEARDWTGARTIDAGTNATMANMPIDDHFFGVAAVAADGTESLVTFAGRAALAR